MFTTHAVRLGLIVGVLSLAAIPAHADFWSDAKNTVTHALPPAPQLPKVDVHVDLKKPLTPVEVDVSQGGATLKVQPSPVPAPPEVHAPGNGIVANMINKGNELAQAPKKWIDQKGEEINRGVIHLGNEIGMLWANFKHDMEQKAYDFLNWLKAQAEKYGIYALAGIGALFLVRGFLQFMIGGRRQTTRHA